MTSTEPIYTPFFGAMGATAAMSFSGEFMREIVKNIIFTVVLIHPWSGNETTHIKLMYGQSSNLYGRNLWQICFFLNVFFY